MTQKRKVPIYGASVYTGKLLAESLAQRRMPFFSQGAPNRRMTNALFAKQNRENSADNTVRIILSAGMPAGIFGPSLNRGLKLK